MLLLSRTALQSHPGCSAPGDGAVGARGAVAPLHCRSGGDLSHPSCDALSDDSVMPSPHSWLEAGVVRLMYVSIFIAFLTCF